MAVLTGIELCAGIGMLGVGAHAAFEFLGYDYKTVCYVEREAPAASQLVTLMEARALPAAPIWSDMLTFDGAAWRGRVDCVIAGFPCQDLSIAGRRAGLNGSRSGLFFSVCDIADACGAPYLLLENVSGIASATAAVVDEEEGALEERAAARVLGELADRGWNAEWITLSASDVGASHGRARWFCFAWREMGQARHDAGHAEHREQPQGASSGPRQSSQSLSVADAERPQRRPQRIAGTGGQQGYDGIGRKAHGGAGIAIEALADSPRHVGHRPCGEIGRRRGVCEASNELDDSIGDGRGTRRHPDGKHDRNITDAASEFPLVDTESLGRRERRAESAGKQRRSDASEHDGAVVNTQSVGIGSAHMPLGVEPQYASIAGSGISVANTSGPRQQGREFARALHGNWGGAGSIWIN